MEARTEEQTLDGFDPSDPWPDPDFAETDAYFNRMGPRGRSARRVMPQVRRKQPQRPHSLGVAGG